MAKLLSEDTECPSWLEIRAGNLEKTQPQTENAASDQIWQNITINLHSGGTNLFSIPEPVPAPETNHPGREACIICRHPYDEMQSLWELLEALASAKSEAASFEPSEPSFELNLKRTREGGIEVYAWLDAGNAATGFYRWDAAGIRFYTTDNNLKSFLDQLKSEFLGK